MLRTRSLRNISTDLSETKLFTADAWLSETMARPVFKWNGMTPVSAEPLAAAMRQLAAGGDAFFFARTPTTPVETTRILNAAGFALIDTSITFAWTDERPWPATAVSVTAARADQHAAIADIAERSFKWSRFHLDPRVGLPLANFVKRRWIENYCLGRRGAALYAAEVGGTVAGFLAVVESAAGGQPAATIDLVAVSPEFQGQRVGAALVRSFVSDWRGRASQLRVGTQAANIASMRFYEGLGFRAAESNYVLHAHFRQGALWA